MKITLHNYSFLLLLCTSPVLAQTSPVRLHPIAQAPSLQLGAGPNNVAPDPRATAIADWLQNKIQTAPKAAPVPGVARADAQKKALQNLEKRLAGPVEVRFRKENGTPLQIKGQPLEWRPAVALQGFADPDEGAARKFLRENRDLLLLADPDQELAFTKKESDGLNHRHLRFVQKFQTLPVWPCELTVHLDPGGNVVLVEGAFVPTPAGIDTKPALTAEQAIQQAKAQFAAAALAQVTVPELVIYSPLPGPARLAWKFDLTLGLGKSWRFVVDALNGQILNRTTLTPHAADTGSGVDAAGQTRTLNLWKDGTTYYLLDASKPMFDPTSTPPDPKKTRGGIIIMDSKNTPGTDNPQTLGDFVQATSTSATAGWVPDAVSAAFGLSVTYDYYRQHHDRNSLDGKGGTVVGIVRVGVKFPNAFWDGQNNLMVFGDGYPKGIDVCGHELTHGVIDSIGNGGILEYHEQPGALNEALADIFGEMVQSQLAAQPDWLMGEDLAEGPLRNFVNPSAIEFAPGEKLPSKMSEFVRLPNTSDGDEGGVHINSSIINHAYYLLAAGMKEPIGARDAERIFYRTMTLHLQKLSQFIDMRHGCIASAEELFGKDSTQARKTAEAFDAVEIIDAPVTPPPSTLPVVQGPDSTLALRYHPTLGVLYLIRRETARNDSLTGAFVETLNVLAARRAVVSGDGSFALYVTADNDLGYVNTDGTAPELLGYAGTVHSVALSPDGSQLAFVLLDSFGDPTNEINLIDLATKKTRTIQLYAPGTEGAQLDVVQYADSMDFMPDGQSLIYDAYSEIETKNGNFFGGWTLFALNLATGNISMLIDLNEGLDFGNPSLGNVHNELLTYETIDKASSISTLYVGNLRTGQTAQIAKMGEAGALGTPVFTGDDTAVVYAQVDPNVSTGFSLYRQALGTDGLSPNGSPTVWLSDAVFGAVYRRGAFVSSNAPPTVTLTSPTAGQNFAAGATITLQAAASDSDGNIVKVEFYAGSTKLGEDAAAPFSFSWTGVAAGEYRLVARAYDNLGSASDSPAVAIIVALPIPGGDFKITSMRRKADASFEMTFNTLAGNNYTIEATTDFQAWTKVGTLAASALTAVFLDAESGNFPHRFYRVMTGSASAPPVNNVRAAASSGSSALRRNSSRAK